MPDLCSLLQVCVRSNVSICIAMIFVAIYHMLFFTGIVLAYSKDVFATSLISTPVATVIDSNYTPHARLFGCSLVCFHKCSMHVALSHTARVLAASLSCCDESIQVQYQLLLVGIAH